MGNAVSTRERILDQGLALMSQAGLEGVTLGVLADQVGMSKSGLFAHFRSKEEVQISLLEHTARVGAEHIIAPSMKQPEGLPRLKALVKHWFGWAPRAGLPGGCPVAAGLFEFDDIAGPVRNKILEMEAEWRALLIQTVTEARSLGHLRSDLDADPIRVGAVWNLSEPSRGAALSEIRRCRPPGRARVRFSAGEITPFKKEAQHQTSRLSDAGQGLTLIEIAKSTVR